jgi:hypothetical protein
MQCPCGLPGREPIEEAPCLPAPGVTEARFEIRDMIAEHWHELDKMKLMEQLQG